MIFFLIFFSFYSSNYRGCITYLWDLRRFFFLKRLSRVFGLSSPVLLGGWNVNFGKMTSLKIKRGLAGVGIEER